MSLKFRNANLERTEMSVTLQQVKRLMHSFLDVNYSHVSILKSSLQNNVYDYIRSLISVTIKGDRTEKCAFL